MSTSVKTPQPLPLTYRAEDGVIEIDLLTDQETMWLTQAQMTKLFDRTRTVIGKHIANVFVEGELHADSVSAKFALTADDGKSYDVQHYNLDVVISVGYRVRSTRGTQFRQWATRTLRTYLEQGYVLNKRRVGNLDAVNTILKRALSSNMETPVREDFLALLERYEHGLTLLDQYDHGSLDGDRAYGGIADNYRLTYADAKEQVQRWRISRWGPDRAPLEGTPAYKLDLFGIEKDGSFQASIDGIYASWDGEEVYPSVLQKAANLLYFLVKNHSFSDGNKRIAAGLFIYYLERNDALYRADGSKRVADNALVALTLFIAMSPADQQDAVVAMTVNLIDERN